MSILNTKDDGISQIINNLISVNPAERMTAKETLNRLHLIKNNSHLQTVLSCQPLANLILNSYLLTH